MGIKQGDKVKVEYTGTLEDGTEFDSSAKHGQPLDVEVGAGQVIKGFEDALMGMEEGEEKEVTFPPEEAYGEPKDDFVKEVPREQLPADVKEGSMLGVTLPNGAQLPAKVVKLEEKTAKVDLNHPLAGKALTFKLKVVKIN